MLEWEDFKKQQTFKTKGYEQYKKVNVACPKCGKPIYKNLTVILPTYPPQYRYECLECGWTDSAFH